MAASSSSGSLLRKEFMMMTMTRNTRKHCRHAEAQTLPIRIVDWIAQALERHHQRQVLAQLSAHELSDIGLSRRDVADEIAKPFWRA